MSLIDVVIINHNTRDFLRACLKSIDPGIVDQLIVVDNASTDGSTAMVKDEFPSTTLIENNSNIGYGPAANRAITIGHAKYVLLLNSDVQLNANTYSILYDYMEHHPQVAILGPQLVQPDGKIQHSCFPFPTLLDVFLDISNFTHPISRVPYLKNRYIRTWCQDQTREVPWILGAVIIIRREAFEQMKGFDESFFMYYEEVDLSFRLLKNGWKTQFTPSATAVHVGGASTQQKHAEMLVYLYESLARFYRRHYSKLELYLLIILIDVVVMMRYIRDVLLLQVRQDKKSRDLLQDQIGAWKKLLSTPWYLENNQPGSSPVIDHRII